MKTGIILSALSVSTLSWASAAALLPKTVMVTAPEEDGQWTMPAKNYASTRFS